jgi:hypothetical protein
MKTPFAARGPSARAVVRPADGGAALRSFSTGRDRESLPQGILGSEVLHRGLSEPSATFPAKLCHKKEKNAAAE